MAEAKTGHVRRFLRRGARATPGDRSVILRSIAPLALALLSACFSAEAYTEHLCRTCTSECPEGLTCYEQRCVPACNASCFGDHHCVEGACVPVDGSEACLQRTVSLPLCVGQSNDVVAATSSGDNPEDPWVVLDSSLPEGVSFNPETGRLSGAPARAEPGSITVRQGPPGSEELKVEVAGQICPQIETTSISWCRGRDESTELIPSLPGPHEWHVSPELGLSLQGDVLSGNVTVADTYSLLLELRVSGRVVDEVRLELTVRDCGGGEPTDFDPPPLEITSLAALPNACEGVDYGAKFDATGGTPDYHWTLETELAGLALEATSGRLTGAPLASGDFDLGVSVEDAAGSRDSIMAPLHVVAASEECVTSPLGPTEEEACNVGETLSCPRAPLRIASTSLGVACVGDDFSARLEATGGGGDYRWYLSNSAPTGLALERTGELHGIPAADAARKYQLSVYVTSTLIDRPGYGTVTLEIVPCDGLVFLTDSAGAGQLFLASTSSDAVSELSDGVLADGESVHSFALSADGVHLAFDVTGENAARRLYWVDLTTLEARLPSFYPALPDGASVVDYRWSLDGSQLAATFRVGDDVFLGVSPAAGSPGSTIYIAGRYRSSLFWAGGRICYVAPGLLEPFLGVLCHAITSDGVEDQAPLTGSFDPTTFRADLVLSSDEGYLAILPDPLAPSAQYLLPSEIGSSAQHIGRVFSPGLHRAAGPSRGDASIFEVFTSRGAPTTPIRLAQLDPCDKLDAWSFDERSIACRSGDSLAIHQLGPNGELASSASVQNSAGYPEEEFRRLMAPGGQWYAYDANDALRVVSLATTPPRSRLIVEGDAQAPYAGLGTDASGTHLYYHHGSELEVVDTRADFVVHNVNGAVLLPDPAPCNESQLDDGPRLWCGAQSTPSFFFPAPGAARVAFVDRQNQLHVADVASAAAGEEGAAPRLVHASSVKCTMDSGETACDNFVQWVPRREPK